MPPPDLESRSTDVTLLLSRWREGDAEAFDQASAILYPELRRIADAYLRRERPNHTLQPTALIHEAFLRFTGAGTLKFESRKQFYALAAQLMRQILVDHARSVKAQKRGGGAMMVTLDQVGEASMQMADQFLTVHEALMELKEFSPRKAQVIELRHFGGLSLEETAEVLEISPATAHREQRLAEAWLTKRIAG